MNGKVIVSTENYSGFRVHNWTLLITNNEGKSKSFYLGQDAKFCSRVLGMEPRYVVEQIGDNDLGNPETLEKLGNFIIETLELEEDKVFELESWDLCCQ